MQQPGGVPNHRGIVAFTLLLALVTFLVRISYPIDQWVDPLPFISLEPAHLPYYISLFALGSVAYRRKWLELLPTRTGMTWLCIGLVAAILPYSELLLHEYASLDIGLVSAGGFSIEALVWSVIESFLCVGLCIGLLTLFREHFNHQGRLARHLTAASYAVYVIHVFPVLAIQQALAALALAPLAKFAVVVLTAVPLSFLLGAALRKLPGARRVL